MPRIINEENKFCKIKVYCYGIFSISYEESILEIGIPEQTSRFHWEGEEQKDLPTKLSQNGQLLQPRISFSPHSQFRGSVEWQGLQRRAVLNVVLLGLCLRELLWQYHILNQRKTAEGIVPGEEDPTREGRHGLDDTALCNRGGSFSQRAEEISNRPSHKIQGLTLKENEMARILKALQHLRDLRAHHTLNLRRVWE